MKHDVIIIGAGSMGMAAGYFLSKQGKKVLLVDSFDPPHANGSHHGETRIIRYAYGEGEAYLPLALRAKALWAELERESGREIFLETGVLNVGNHESRFIKNVVSSSEKYSLPLEVMSSDEVNHKWPGLSLAEDLIGCFEPTSGVLKSEECIVAYRELAGSAGATLQTNTKVHNITVENDGETVIVKTDKGVFQSESLIVSAGAWSKDVLRMLDVDLPLQPVRKTFTWFDVDKELYKEGNFPAFSFETSFGMYYGFPSIDGAGLKVGRHDTGEEQSVEDPIVPFGEYPHDAGDVTHFVEQFMTCKHELRQGRTCMYTLTPDEDFIIDLHPKYKNIAIAAGFSGHGFKFSSVVGEILTELITDGKTHLPISPFSIKRFT
ncbi:N-methyl-L-tryptophan oxidase [Evansella sp. AB-rgal1]|uniref:N-methyl-L-tryptophan oxidase n=1 Tax=Evansella sp. AB-rgal1 TaxID=3242696 RepID=UPI00359E0C0A